MALHERGRDSSSARCGEPGVEALATNALPTTSSSLREESPRREWLIEARHPRGGPHRRAQRRLERSAIPGVELIELDERFRIVATVNDASIDDIVFPISEGLARRFVRIEMAGANEIEVVAFVGDAPGALEERCEAAAEALREFFRLAEELRFRFDGHDQTEFRIPLGVGYFAPLRSWASGGQALATASEDAPDSIRARRLVSLCLGPARRNPNVRAIQKRLFEFKEIE